MRSSFELADIVQNFSSSLNPQTLKYNQKILDNILECRTAKLGGYVYECTNSACSQRDQAYNSCRDRHCPKCQYKNQQDWVKKRVEELLPTSYFHVVFSIPHEINELFLSNKSEISRILFKCSAEALHEHMKEKYSLKSGAISVLHTWGSNLSLHPHVHMIVPGGGLSLDGKKWISCKKGFLGSVKAISVVFRAKFLRAFKKLYRKNKLKITKENEYLKEPRFFDDFIGGLYQKGFVVYSKKSFKREGHVLKYLGRYTHRIAINNSRIKKIEKGMVHFLVKDYKNKVSMKTCTLHGGEFLRRYLMHSLEKGFIRIRHSGFLASAVKKDSISKAREYLGKNQVSQKIITSIIEEIDNKMSQFITCKSCKEGKMVAVAELPILNSS